MHQYRGSVDNPFPPQGTGGWVPVGYGDAMARARAEQIAAMRGPAGGCALPLWHYHDELLRSGLTRFFAYDDGANRHCIGALRYAGAAATLGQDAAAGDSADTSGTGGPSDVSTLPGGAGLTQTTGGASDAGGGVVTEAPSGGGGNQPLPAPPKPAPAPAPASSSSSSSGGGLVVAVIAALAVAGTIVAASAAKHPVRGSRSHKR